MNTQYGRSGFPLLVLPYGACMAWTDQQVIYDDGLIRLIGHDDPAGVERRREALVGWLERHGIDPNHVPVPGWIVRDETNRCIVYWGSQDSSESVVWNPEVRPPGEVMVEQLEAPPLPFPMPWTPDPVPVSQYPRGSL